MLDDAAVLITCSPGCTRVTISRGCVCSADSTGCCIMTGIHLDLGAMLHANTNCVFGLDEANFWCEPHDLDWKTLHWWADRDCALCTRHPFGELLLKYWMQCPTAMVKTSQGLLVMKGRVNREHSLNDVSQLLQILLMLLTHTVRPDLRSHLFKKFINYFFILFWNISQQNGFPSTLTT